MHNFSLITGSAGLLGNQHAIALAEKKYNLILVDIDKKLVSQFKKIKIKFPKLKVLFFVCDITDEHQIIKMKKELIKKRLVLKCL